MNTTQKIDSYFAATDQLASLGEKKTALIGTVVTPEMKARIQTLTDTVMTEEVKQKLSDIDAEFASHETVARFNIDKLKLEITTDVLVAGKTIRASDGKRMAMYRKGSSTWDGDKLHGYAAAHPEILVFNKVGQPSVILK